MRSPLIRVRTSALIVATLVAKVCRRAAVDLPLRVTPDRCASRPNAQRAEEKVVDRSPDCIRIGTGLRDQEPFADEGLDLGDV